MSFQFADLVEGAPVIDDTVICFPSFQGFYNLSHKERPVGRGPAFASGDVPSRIRSITDRLLLLPTSQSHIAIDFSCEMFSLKKKEQYEVSTFHPRSVYEVRRPLWTGKH